MASEINALQQPSRKEGQPPNWTRRYIPMLSLLVAVLITVAILPSALNLPQSNPSTVIEYAPVPPDSDTPPPPSDGSFSSLGLSSSDTLTTRPPLSTRPPELPDVGAQKPCVGNQQTEDPNSPPCKNVFVGDNGCKTWIQGVTCDEVVALIYNSTGIIIDQGQGRTQETPGHGTYCDVDLMDCDGDGKTDSDPHMWIQIANAYSRYFNSHFQTYNRHVHFYYYWSDADTAAERAADASENWAKLRPFAVIPQPWRGGFTESYIRGMSQRGVMVFASREPEQREFYKRHAPNVWSYWPDVENWADMFVGYMCTKVKGTKVNRGAFSGQDRVYAMMYTTDNGFPNLQSFAQLSMQGMKACGINWVYEAKFPFSGWWIDNNRDSHTYATTNVAEMSSKGVNTVVWLGGSEAKTTQAAQSQKWFPEWIVAGDGDMDGRGFAGGQDQEVWNSAWAISFQLAEDDLEKSYAYKAYKQADPDGTNQNWAVTFYRDYFMLFSAIQVAGPRLNPRQVDIGLHAIERYDSSSPYQAACYFFSEDYSCVKDSMETWWDSDGTAPGGGTGCYRMVWNGQRFARDRWALSMKRTVNGQEVQAGIHHRPNGQPYNNTNEVCTNYGGTGRGIRPGV